MVVWHQNDTNVINQTKRIWLTDKEYVDSHGMDEHKKRKEILDVDTTELWWSEIIYDFNLD
jgi:hypothetical protein